MRDVFSEVFAVATFRIWATPFVFQTLSFVPKTAAENRNGGGKKALRPQHLDQGLLRKNEFHRGRANPRPHHLPDSDLPLQLL
jgi:hypothetical protein